MLVLFSLMLGFVIIYVEPLNQVENVADTLCHPVHGLSIQCGLLHISPYKILSNTKIFEDFACLTKIQKS